MNEAMIVTLYRALQNDARLQRDWKENQPGLDRAFEGPLIARTPREIATAALLIMKLRFEERACAYQDVRPSADHIEFGRTQGSGGGRLARILDGKVTGDQEAVAASCHTLDYYRNRNAPNPLIRMHWSRSGLERLSRAQPDEMLNEVIRPTYAVRKAAAVATVAALKIASPDLEGTELRRELVAIPGVGPERADAIGVFGFGQLWPIVDDYLWKLLARHSVISRSEADVIGYIRRRRLFEPYWCSLLDVGINQAPADIAASLYLWATEAEKFGYEYGL